MNIRVLAKYIGLGAVILSAGAAHAESRQFMPRGDLVTPPPGFVDLCLRDGSACRPNQTLASLTATPVSVQATSSVGGRSDFMSGGFLATFPRAADTAATTSTAPSAVGELAAYRPAIDADFVAAGVMRDPAPLPAAEPAQAMAQEMAMAMPAKAAPLPKSMTKLLNTINQTVNREVHKASDFDLYGVLEYWSLPRVIDGKMYGDCEDFALEKRRRLIEAGVPAQDLSMAVAVTARGESHAVLVVAMEDGDMVLDNLTPWATPWQDLNYHWVERQVAGGADWVAIS